MDDVVCPWDSVHGAPYQEDVQRKLHRWREALKGQLSLVGKDVLIHGLQVNRDSEHGVKNVYRSVRVNLQGTHLLETGDRFHPRVQVGQ